MHSPSPIRGLERREEVDVDVECAAGMRPVCGRMGGWHAPQLERAVLKSIVRDVCVHDGMDLPIARESASAQSSKKAQTHRPTKRQRHLVVGSVQVLELSTGTISGVVCVERLRECPAGATIRGLEYDVFESQVNAWTLQCIRTSGRTECVLGKSKGSRRGEECEIDGGENQDTDAGPHKRVPRSSL